MEKTVELQRASILAFINENNILNEKGQSISFEDRRFLIDPLCDWSRFQVYKKAAQVGMTVTFLVKESWACKNKRWNIGHTFPSDTDANSFVSTKANPMFANNKVFLDIQSDNVERKQIGENFLFFMGTQSQAKALEKSLDVLIHDEIDRSNQSIIQMFRSRLQASKVKAIWKLSNPSIEGAGVDIDWHKSDQKEWHITCENGHSHPMTWPDSVDIENKKFICKECGVELTDQDRREGEWIDKDGKPWNGELSEKYRISGYHMTLLMCPWVTVDDILLEWNEGKDPEHFNNFVLGEPYSPGDTKITRTMILDNWTPQNIRTNNLYMGVDVGTRKNYVIGSDKGIIQVGTFTDWSDFEDMMERHTFSSVVIDALPDTTYPAYYKDKYRNVFICYFRADQKTNSVVRWGEKDKYGIIEVDKHRYTDQAVNELLYGRILYGLPADGEFQEYIKQCEVMRRVKEVDRNGIEKWRWRALGEEDGKKEADHYWQATIYYLLARSSVAGGIVVPDTLPGATDPIKNTTNGVIVGDLGSALEQAQYGNDGDF